MNEGKCVIIIKLLFTLSATTIPMDTNTHTHTHTVYTKVVTNRREVVLHKREKKREKQAPVESGRGEEDLCHLRLKLL